MESPNLRGHESRDANFPKVMLSGLGLLGVMLFGLLVSLGLYLIYSAHTPQPGAHPGTFTRPNLSEFPAPRLEEDPHAAILALRRSEDSLLSSYGRVDSTFARVPISRAMEMIVTKGLPSWQEPPVRQMPVRQM